jgi:predicted Zn-dependent protease
MLDLSATGGDGSNEDAIQQQKAAVAEIKLGAQIGRGSRKVARAANDRGLENVRAGFPQEAIADFRAAHSTDPGDVEILNNLGYGYFSVGNLCEAKAVLQFTLMLAPDRGAAWANFGQVIAKDGNMKSAVGAFANVLRFSKDLQRTRQFFQDLSQKDDDSRVREAAGVVLQLKISQDILSKATVAR